MSNETTTSFSADISKFKKAFSDAQKTIRLANSEFKKTSATMDDWSKSTDGLQAKIEQLDTVFGAEKQKLESLKNQYEAVKKEQGENSAGAEALKIKINNQSAAVAKAEKNLNQYKNKLTELEKEQSKVQTAYEKTSQEIDEQESELIKLKLEYSNLVLTQGKSSSAAEEVASKIGKLSTELNENRKAMQQAEDAADDLDNSLEKTEVTVDNVREGFTVLKGAVANLIADGIKNIGSAVANQFKTMITESKAAYNDFQAQTGETTESVAEFNDEIDEIYKNNYGESLSDVADAMAKVKQQTNETDPSKISKMTENALALRDTYDYDLSESLRAVKMLMDQFGISSEDAYNLIVQGTQQGLNKNGDLLDTINEYAVHYKQLGYNQNEFLSSLINGTEKGTFSVDKLGDAMKEFGIRTKDTAESTTEGYEIIGLDAKKMRQEFAKGGKSAQQATNKTLKALMNMDDKVKQNQAGVDLFGTMWEDLGIEGVKALTNVNNRIDNSKDSMEELKKIKYDDITNDFKALGRSIQMDFIAPMAKKALPYAEKFTKYCINNLDELVPKIKTVGAVVATAFVVNKVANFTKSISTLTSTFTTLSNPVGLTIAGIGALTAIIAACVPKEKEITASTQKLLDEVSKTNEKLNKETEAWKELTTARQDAVENTENEFLYYQDLKDELDSIVDKNGKVRKGYEDRANTIANTLEEALGCEIEFKNGFILNYDEMGKSVDNLIEKQKASSILKANEGSYTKAKQNLNSSFSNYNNAKKDLSKLKEELKEAQKTYDEALKNRKSKDTLWGALSGDYSEAREKFEQTRTDLNALEDKYDECTNTLKNYKETYVGYSSTIANYESAQSAIISGNIDKISEATSNLANNLITAENGTSESLENQKKRYKQELKELQDAVKDGSIKVTDAQLKEAERLVKESKKELKKYKNNYKKMAMQSAAEVIKAFNETDWLTAGKNALQGFINGLMSKNNDLNTAVKSSMIGATSAMMKTLDEHSPSRVTRKIGVFFSQGFINGVISLYKKAKAAAQGVGGASIAGIMLGIDKGDYKGIGEKLITHYTNAINSQAKKVSKSMKSLIISAIKEGQKSIKAPESNNIVKKAKKEFADVGQDMIDSFGKAIEKGATKAITKVKNSISKISEAYQEQYNDIIDKQDALKSTLSDYGDLFERDNNGKIKLSDLKAQTNFLRDYGSNLEKLKSQISNDLMGVITSMSAEDGADLASKLLSLNTADLKAFDNAYKEKQKVSAQISKNYYQSEIDSLKKNFTTKINKQLKTLKSDLKEVGKQSVEGFIKGFESKNGKVSKYVETWAKGIIKTIKKEWKIHSPSRVSKFELMGNFMQGMIDGVAIKARKVTNTVRDLTSGIVDSANSSISGMRSGLSGGYAHGGTNVNNNTATYNFYQTNNSPKALNRLEIYRDSKNLMKFVKGVT